jgi:hypothetical protein
MIKNPLPRQGRMFRLLRPHAEGMRANPRTIDNNFARSKGVRAKFLPTGPFFG